MRPIGGGSALNFNTTRRCLAAKRQTATKRGKGEMASTNGACSTGRPRTATLIAEFSTTTRPTAEALIVPFIRATSLFSVHVTTLRIENPSARASCSLRWKRLQRRRGSGRRAPRISHSPRSDTWPLETYLRTQAGCLEPTAASLARKLAARPSWSRKGQSGDWGFETASPAVWRP